jgi:hypothetical protein
MDITDFTLKAANIAMGKKRMTPIVENMTASVVMKSDAPLSSSDLLCPGATNGICCVRD